MCWWCFGCCIIIRVIRVEARTWDFWDDGKRQTRSGFWTRSWSLFLLGLWVFSRGGPLFGPNRNRCRDPGCGSRKIRTWFGFQGVKLNYVLHLVPDFGVWYPHLDDVLLPHEDSGQSWEDVGLVQDSQSRVTECLHVTPSWVDWMLRGRGQKCGGFWTHGSSVQEETADQILDRPIHGCGYLIVWLKGEFGFLLFTPYWHVHRTKFSFTVLLVSGRRKSKPILPKVYAQLVNANSKMQGSRSVKTNGLTRSDPFSVCTPLSVQQQISSYTR